jgi:hypothetical protein
MTQMMPQKSWAHGLCVFGPPCGGFFFRCERSQQKFRNFVRLNAGFWSEEIEGVVVTLGQLAAAKK